MECDFILPDEVSLFGVRLALLNLRAIVDTLVNLRNYIGFILSWDNKVEKVFCINNQSCIFELYLNITWVNLRMHLSFVLSWGKEVEKYSVFN